MCQVGMLEYIAPEVLQRLGGGALAAINPKSSSCTVRWARWSTWRRRCCSGWAGARRLS